MRIITIIILLTHGWFLNNDKNLRAVFEYYDKQTNETIRFRISLTAASNPEARESRVW